MNDADLDAVNLFPDATPEQVEAARRLVAREAPDLLEALGL